jgi:hypothetical protein
MAIITNRVTKGAPLTFAELDDNFANLNGESVKTMVYDAPNLVLTKGDDTTIQLDLRGLVTYESLESNDDIGPGAFQVAIGNHTHVVEDITDFAEGVIFTGDGRYLLEGNNLSDLTNLEDARANLGLGNVNNTSDADKPISDAVQAALDAGAGGEVVPLVGGGVIPINALVKQIRDSGEYTMVNASSVDAETMILVELPELFKGQTPKITADGTNVFRTSLGTDNVIQFEGATLIELVSDGSNEWFLFELAANGVDGENASNFVTSVAGRQGAVVLTSTDVGLANVDNTSDSDKPVSNAVESSINVINASINDNTTSIGNIAASINNVDNTSDIDKPISELTQSSIANLQEQIDFNFALASAGI